LAVNRAGAERIGAIAEFLMARPASSMFPLSNLSRHGHQGGHPRAMRFWAQYRDGALTDVMGQSDEGLVFPQCPTDPWGAAARVLAPLGVKGFIGEARQVSQLREALGLTGPAGLDMVEPHYHLSLEDIKMPSQPDLTLIPLASAPRNMMRDWRAAFCVEAMNFPPDEAQTKAEMDIASFVRDGSHRVLMSGNDPVAMTGFNATLPEIVQVGGVYTPPDQRARGYARLAVARHLYEARRNGAKQAVLTAATPAAARAYEAIGFKRIGDFAMAIWSDRQAVHV